MAHIVPPFPLPSALGMGNEPWLASFFSASTAALVIIGPDLRYLRVNDVAARFHGVPAADHQGRTVREMIPAMADRVEPLLRRVITTGATLLDVEVSGETPATPGQIRHWHASFFPLTVGPDHPPGVGVVAVEITARKNAEHALQRQRDLLLEAQQVGELGSWDWDLRSDALQWSGELYRLFGIDRQTGEPTVPRVLASVEPDDRSRVQAALTPGQPVHETAPCEFRFHRSDGVQRVGLLRAHVELNDSGQPVRRYGIVQDVTERARAKRALRDSELLWRSVFAAAHDAMLLLEPDLRITAANEMAEKMYGCAADQLVGADARSLSIEDRCAEDAAKLRQAVADDGLRWETIHRRGNGTPFAVEVSVRPVNEGPGSRLVKIVRELSERKAAEQQIRFQASLLNQVRNAVIATDAEGRIVFWNHFAESLYQWSAQEVLGRHIVEITVAPEESPLAGEIMAALLRGESWEGELPVRRKDGTRIIAWVAGTPVRNDLGDLIGVVGISIDITESKRVQAALEQSQERLRQLAKRLDQVREEEARRIARDVHDALGQQLTAIKLELQFLESSLPVGSPAAAQGLNIHRLLDGTIRAAQRIASELRLGHLEVVGLAAAITWDLREFARRTGIVARAGQVAELEEVDRACAIATFRIYQEAITNIARHAAASEVEVSLYGTGDRLVLRVEDNGRGIHPDRLESPDAIGLLGMRERAQALRGSVTIAPRKNGGTAVTAVLPRRLSSSKS